MFSKIRRRITYTNVVVTLALVFAMSGGAYAAGHYLITSTKQISPKVLKQLKGNSGANGTNGTSGSAGPGGPAGPAGPAGPGGAKGETGATGEKGPAGDKGTPGTNGKEGSPWTAGGTLPSGKTETGAWTFSEPEGSSQAETIASISFSIPLQRPGPPAEATEDLLDEKHALYVTGNEQEKFEAGKFGSAAEELCEGESGSELAECMAHYKAIFEDCPGGFVEPKAEAGFLCVYEGFATGVVGGKGIFGRKAQAQVSPPAFHGALGEKGASAVGAVVRFESEGEGKHYGNGTWAVTAE